MWMNGLTSEPQKNGEYIVMKGYSEVEEDFMAYTVEGGWNTFINSDGELVGTTRQSDEYINSDGYIKAWFQVPKYNPAEVAG